MDEPLYQRICGRALRALNLSSPSHDHSKIYSDTGILPPEKWIWVRRISDKGHAAEHFPCKHPPRDLRWVTPRSACCTEVYLGFWDTVKQRGLKLDEGVLSLMRVCQRMYLDLYSMYTFCFDDLNALTGFMQTYPSLPIRHVQIVLYVCPLTFKEYDEEASAAALN
ncbi:hypothetical protein B0T14DRAFT_563748 [Immersiella caudata]|uniref:Uncharacterized protein n=1 Tax=Immersiella caudata TaxID=314043 RepID=A0AA39X639_9PEZI|nr:hypothetical protein B0T14DRAFT_563748 [Immersiella caudata]